MRVAVLGATGAVGRELLVVLERRRFPVRELFALASSRSAGKTLPFGGGEVEVRDAEGFDFSVCDIVFCCVGSDTARRFVPRAIEAGCFVVDNSSAYRMQPDVPLVVPEINGDEVRPPLVANPNCTTAITLVALAPLHRRWRLRRLIAATYQAASGAGAAAISELLSHTDAALKGSKPKPSLFPHSLAFNLFPHIGDFAGSYTTEELKLEQETRKILNEAHIKVSAFCVRVPVVRAHSVAAFVCFDEQPDQKEAEQLIKQSSGVELHNPYPTPLDAEGKDAVLVGRIRSDAALERALSLWIVGDQLLKGAALNAVQIGEKLLEVI